MRTTLTSRPASAYGSKRGESSGFAGLPSQGGKWHTVALLEIAVEPIEFLLVGRIVATETVLEKRERLHQRVPRQLLQL